MLSEKRSEDMQRMRTGAHGTASKQPGTAGARFLHIKGTVRRRLQNPTSDVRGFTLLEVVIVVTIIAILASSMLPGVLNEQTTKLKSATDDIIDMFVRARMRAASGSHAFGVRVEQNEKNGTISVHQGTSAACTSINWDLAVPVGKAVHDDGENSRQIYGLSFAFDYPVERGDIRIEALMPDINRVCYTPDGRMVDGDTGKAIVGSGDYAAGEYIIEINAYLGTKAMGVPHRIVVPWSGTPRFVYVIEDGEEEGLGGT